MGLTALVLSALFAADAPRRHAALEAPANWMAAVETHLAHQEYFATGAVLQAPNRAHDLRTYFTPRGVRVVPRVKSEHDWEWDLSLASYGTESHLQVPRSVIPSPHENRVDYRRGALDEWYLNDCTSSTEMGHLGL
jgi:hypothetical protein